MNNPTGGQAEADVALLRDRTIGVMGYGSGVPWANLFARVVPAQDTGKLALTHATQTLSRWVTEH